MSTREKTLLDKLRSSRNKEPLQRKWVPQLSLLPKTEVECPSRSSSRRCVRRPSSCSRRSSRSSDKSEFN